MRVLSIGEVLWDIYDRDELLGGAALNVCVNLHHCGDTAFLVSGVGKDRRGKAVFGVHRPLRARDQPHRSRS